MEKNEMTTQLSNMFEYADEILDNMVNYKELIMMYTSALKIVQNRFEILNNEFKFTLERNPINSITTRIKSTSSIIEKLTRRNLKPSLEVLENNIHDIAGIRIICTYIDDVYRLASALTGQKDLEIVETKDYIKNPKENGYRSLHIIIKAPVYFFNTSKKMSVEIQIRTIAMNCWAELEHEMKYKQEITNEEKMQQELKICADELFLIDSKMQNIKKEIDKYKDKPTKRDKFMSKLKLLSDN